LSQHVRDQNQAERDWRLAEAERMKQAEAIVPAVTPSHAEIVADFRARRASVLSTAPQHVEGAPYRVRFRQHADRWEQVRHFATQEDRDRYIAIVERGAAILQVWEC
jgi:hypothetical protein